MKPYPYLSLTEYRNGNLNVVRQKHLPKEGIEKDIVDALNSVFDNPNFAEYTKDLNDDYYFIIVYLDNKICKEDLRKLEHDSKCKVEIKHRMYGLAFFFTPRSERDMNPSER